MTPKPAPGLPIRVLNDKGRYHLGQREHYGPDDLSLLPHPLAQKKKKERPHCHHLDRVESG